MSFRDLVGQMDAALVAAFKEEPTSDLPALTYTPPGGVATPVDGIFDEAYVFAAEGEAGLASSGPAVWFRLADLPTNPETDDDGAIVTVNGTTYSVKNVKPDGMGGIRLFLYDAPGR